MKVKDLMRILQGCNPNSDVVVEDERTKELFKCSYCEYDVLNKNDKRERKKVFIGASFEGVK